MKEMEPAEWWAELKRIETAIASAADEKFCALLGVDRPPIDDVRRYAQAETVSGKLARLNLVLRDLAARALGILGQVADDERREALTKIVRDQKKAANEIMAFLPGGLAPHERADEIRARIEDEIRGVYLAYDHVRIPWRDDAPEHERRHEAAGR